MDDIAENLFIGNFLLGLGLRLGHDSRERPYSPIFVGNNQTLKLDECYADVMLKNASLMRVIEFKREYRAFNDLKEAAKLKLLQENLAWGRWSDKERTILESVSREVHLYVETPREVGPNASLRVAPYLDKQQVNEKPLLNLTSFIQTIAYQATEAPKSQEELDNYEPYLALLCGCRGSKGAALVICGTPEGGLTFEVVDDLRTIITPQAALVAYKLQHRLRLETKMEQKIAMAMEHSRDHVRTLRRGKELREKRALDEKATFLL